MTGWSHSKGFPRNTRRRILHRDPICRHCHTAPSTVADHIIPVAEGGTDRIENGQGLCGPCHDRKTYTEQQRGRHRHPTRRPPTPHPGLRPHQGG